MIDASPGVQNHQLILATGEDDVPRDVSGTPVCNIMDFFSSDQVPVSTALARAFQVVDTYHASAPCQTLPNRSLAQLGTVSCALIEICDRVLGETSESRVR